MIIKLFFHRLLVHSSDDGSNEMHINDKNEEGSRLESKSESSNTCWICLKMMI